MIGRSAAVLVVVFQFFQLLHDLRQFGMSRFLFMSWFMFVTYTSLFVPQTNLLSIRLFGIRNGAVIVLVDCVVEVCCLIHLEYELQLVCYTLTSNAWCGVYCTNIVTFLTIHDENIRILLPLNIFVWVFFVIHWIIVWIDL